MTRLRQPLTFARALTRIADLLGWDGCAAACGKSESLLRKLGAPDTERTISLQDALRLDGAYLRAGGNEPPLLQCYTLLLDISTGGRDDGDSLLNATSQAAHESGEALAASIRAATGQSQSRDTATAFGEVEQAIDALQAVLRKLGGQMAEGAQ